MKATSGSRMIEYCSKLAAVGRLGSRDKISDLEGPLVNTESHIAHLKEKHAQLEHDIEQEEQHPYPDTIKLSQMKREKLRIKDEIATINVD